MKNKSKKEYPKLPKEFKEKWIAALRSGKYKQADGHLTINGRYCCLGVACKAIGKRATRVSWDLEYISTKLEGIPESIRGDSKTAMRLASMNDREVPFSKIADWIEVNL